MPILQSSYLPPLLFRNGHTNTIIPKFFRTIKEVTYQRKRIETEDNDFLDLDFSMRNSRSIVVVIHGLEGSSEGHYVKGIVRAVNAHGWDAVALNLRGCSEEDNRNYYSYHSGKSDDLSYVVDKLIGDFGYAEIRVVGFSLGGNITLKYAGECGSNLPSEVKAVAAVSVPCSLESAAEVIGNAFGGIYLRRFLKTLKVKAIAKKEKHPDAPLSIDAIQSAKDFFDYDGAVTAPANGFKDAKDYYTRCSCKQFLPNIKIPAYLINAVDDPFFGEACFPYKEAKANKNFLFEAPSYGGHVGFVSCFNFQEYFWHEQQIMRFFKDGL